MSEKAFTPEQIREEAAECAQHAMRWRSRGTLWPSERAKHVAAAEEWERRAQMLRFAADHLDDDTDTDVADDAADAALDAALERNSR